MAREMLIHKSKLEFDRGECNVFLNLLHAFAGYSPLREKVAVEEWVVIAAAFNQGLRRKTELTLTVTCCPNPYLRKMNSR